MIDGSGPRADAVARQIEDAFRSIRYPGDGRLVKGSSEEAFEIADLLRGRHWSDLTLDELVENYASVFFMSPEALRFYLPAYLRAATLNYDASDQVPGTLMRLLRPPAAGEIEAQKLFDARFSSLTQPQRDAVRAFLQYLREGHREDFPSESGVDEPSLLLRWWGQPQRSQ